MRICLHIGKPRTGTTSFQRGMAGNRESLKADGVIYPASEGIDPRHMQLFWSAIGRDNLKKLHRWHIKSYDGLSLDARVAQIASEAIDAETLVISNEWFSMTFAPETFLTMVERLKELGPVTVFVTLRHQADAIISSWVRQVIDRGKTGPLSSVTAIKGDWGRSDQPMNHLALARGWAKHCNVVALPYGADQPYRLASAMGIAGVEFDRDPPGPPLSLCEFLRRKSRTFPSREDWKVFVAEVATDPERFAEHRDSRTLEMAEMVRTRFTLAYERSNRILAEEFDCQVQPGKPDYR